jgi:hypothetical protein
MKKIIPFIIWLPFFGFSQENESIQTDRPDQTETPFLVPKSMFQVENGFSFQKNNTNSNTITLPSSLWKYGVNENFELRLITEFSIEKNFDSEISGLNPVLIGCKIKIAEEKGIFPKTSFIGHIGLPNVASSKNKNEFTAAEFRFVMQHTLSKKMSFSYNLGSEWNGNSPEATFIYTIATGYSISERLNTTIYNKSTNKFEYIDDPAGSSLQILIDQVGFDVDHIIYDYRRDNHYQGRSLLDISKEGLDFLIDKVLKRTGQIHIVEQVKKQYDLREDFLYELIKTMIQNKISNRLDMHSGNVGVRNGLLVFFDF